MNPLVEAYMRGRIRPQMAGFDPREPLNSGEIISTPSDSALGARGDIYPLAKYRTPDGRQGVDVAWPRMLVPSPEMDRPEDGFKLALGGGMAARFGGPVPGAVGAMRGGKQPQALDMSQEARLAIRGGLDDLPTVPPPAASREVFPDWNRRAANENVTLITDFPDHIGATSGDAMVDGPIRNGMLRLRSGTKDGGKKGFGYGGAAYRAVIDDAHRRGLPVGSDSSVSADAQRVYESLKRDGYDVQQNPEVERNAWGSLQSIDQSKPVFTVGPRDGNLMAAQRSNLDMSQEARLARAREMGFDSAMQDENPMVHVMRGIY